ncbi:hypothetical protein [Actinoplanes rectilineatus]|uniref:hypothetical protein n=1 Tax=Actinoplanes rectilineatus TaxID=113571 RepID=UPI000AB73556|nr:hypothetical protein [Actinoplanes rectilineatus]
MIIILGAASGLAACSVPEEGITGLTVDAQGDLWGAVAMCYDDPPDVVYLAGFRPAPAPSQSAPDNHPSLAGEELGEVEYTVPRGAGRVLSFPLEAPADGWVASLGPPRLLPDVDYRLYGHTKNNSFRTMEVAFRLSDRERLAPGTVLIQDVRSDEDVLVSQAEFADRGKRFCLGT